MDGSRAPIPIRLCLFLCGLTVAVPFLQPYHYYPFPTFYSEWLAFALGLAALIAMAFAPSARPVPVPAMCLGLLAFTAVLVVQVALGQVAYPLRSAMGALYALWAALLVMLGAWLGSELGEQPVARTLQWWVAVAGTLAAASGFFQYYHTPLPVIALVVPQPLNAMFGFVGQPNNFADYLGIALLSIACLHARAALRFAPAALMALLVAAGMALSGSRTSWGYMAIMLVLAPLFFRGDGPEAGRRFARLVALALAVFVLVQVLNVTSDVFTGPEGKPLSAGERFARYFEIPGAAAERPIRIQFFLYAWLMFLSNPLLGMGFSEYAWRAFQIAADMPGVIPPGLDRHSHNLVLQLLAETGIAGLLCVLAPLASWLLRNTWRRLAPERRWAAGALAVMGLHSMVEFPLWYSTFLGLFALLFGLLSPASAELRMSATRRGALIAVLAAASLVAGKALGDYRAFEQWFLRLEAEGARGSLAEIKGVDALLAQQGDSLFEPYFERLLSVVLLADEEGLDDKLALNSQVLRLYPVPSVVERQIELLALAGRDAEAARMLRAAARIYPESTASLLPVLERLARERPERFAALLASARADLAAVEQGRAFAPWAGKR